MKKQNKLQGIERCPYCGTYIQKNKLGDYVCPNCGIVGSDSEGIIDPDSSYLG